MLETNRTWCKQETVKQFYYKTILVTSPYHWYSFLGFLLSHCLSHNCRLIHVVRKTNGQIYISYLSSATVSYSSDRIFLIHCTGLKLRQEFFFLSRKEESLNSLEKLKFLTHRYLTVSKCKEKEWIPLPVTHSCREISSVAQILCSSSWGSREAALSFYLSFV